VNKKKTRSTSQHRSEVWEVNDLGELAADWSRRAVRRVHERMRLSVFRPRIETAIQNGHRPIVHKNSCLSSWSSSSTTVSLRLVLAYRVLPAECVGKGERALHIITERD